MELECIQRCLFLFICLFMCVESIDFSDSSNMVNPNPQLSSFTPNVQKINLIENLQSLVEEKPFRQFNNQKYFLSKIPYSIQSMVNPAIVLVGCRRLSMMEDIVRSLALMKSIDSYTIYISFGCPESLTSDLSEVTSLFHSIMPDIQFLQYLDPPSTSSPSPFLRIQLHYVFILKQIFEKHNHSEVILLEDDLQLSPSLLDYFEQTFQLLYQDSSLFCISAFNDNALAELEDKQRLRRTAYFPNLGLLFNKEGYNQIWKDQPLNSTTNGWDHWLRIRVNSLQGECVIPVVPRIRHLLSANSSTATNSLANRLQKYPLVEESSIDLGNLSYLIQSNYDQSLLHSFLSPSSIPLALQHMNIPIHSFLGSNTNLFPLYEQPIELKDHVMVFVETRDDIRKIKMYKNRVIVVYLLREQFQKYIYSLNLFSTLRGFHKGIFAVTMKGSEIFFIDRRIGWYATPSSLQIRLNPWGQIIKGESGESCNDRCKRLAGDFICDPAQMQFVNECSVMKKHFDCVRGCWNEVSNAIPTYCPQGETYGGMCLISHDAFSTCDASHENTNRLCYCISNATRVIYNHNTPTLRVFQKEIHHHSQN